VLRLASALVAVVLVSAVAAAAQSPTVLPRPRFNAPANGAGTGKVAFQIVSSTPTDPAREVPAPSPRPLRIDGPDGNTQHLVVARDRYAYDFRKFAWPPRIAPGEREFVYEQVVFAKEAAGTLFVETAHSTYAKSSYGLNAYLNAVDLKTRKLRWRSPALVANAANLVLLNDTIVAGYGFTAEPDYLYAIDRGTGRVQGRLLLPSGPQRIARHGNVLTVDTYDHRLVVRVTGA
jgi:outer membrane protein assembly factor BamB